MVALYKSESVSLSVPFGLNAGGLQGSAIILLPYAILTNDTPHSPVHVSYPVAPPPLDSTFTWCKIKIRSHLPCTLKSVHTPVSCDNVCSSQTCVPVPNLNGFHS